jgi:DNA-binding NarL/FixJ family response regulator
VRASATLPTGLPPARMARPSATDRGPGPIRILVVDDHPPVRDGLALVLAGQRDLEVVGVAADGAQALACARDADPDVVVMDLEMPAIDGIEATRRLALACPRARVLILTSFADRERILAALDAGAIGYLLKDAEPADLMEAVRAAARGDTTLAQPAANAIVAARTQAASRQSLTEREREVLALVAEGYPNGRIAHELGIAEKTVKTHLTRVFASLGVADRTQAAFYARRAGLTLHGGLD